jgi:hypothetical protein
VTIEGEIRACRTPPTRSKKLDINFKQVKQENEAHFKAQKASFATPLYDAILELINGGLMSRNVFAKKYDLSCKGLNPKRVKALRDITLEKINKFFGPIVNNNSYS